MLSGIEVVTRMFLAVAAVIGRRAVRRLIAGGVRASGSVRGPRGIAGHFAGTALVFARHIVVLHVSSRQRGPRAAVPRLFRVTEPAYKRKRF